jgi:flagellar biosynthesis protein FlhG
MKYHLKSENCMPENTKIFPASIPGTTITITSGKSGVGKTTIAGNLGVCFHQMGFRVLVVDTTHNEGFCSLFMMEKQSEHSLQDVLDSKAELDDFYSVSPEGIKIISISYDDLMVSENRPLITKIFSQFDVRLVDTTTATKIPDDLVGGPIVGDIAIVTSPDPASVTAAYSRLKCISVLSPQQQGVNLLVNQVDSEREGLDVHNTLKAVSTRYLNRGYDYWGYIPSDWRLRQSVRSQESVVSNFPESSASVQFCSLARCCSFEAMS